MGEDEASLTRAYDRKGGEKEPTVLPIYPPIWTGLVQRLGRDKSVAPKPLGLKLGITWECVFPLPPNLVIPDSALWKALAHPPHGVLFWVPDQSTYPTGLESLGKWYTEWLSLWAFSYTAWFHTLTLNLHGCMVWASYRTSWSHGISFLKWDNAYSTRVTGLLQN